jgi:hypothetical protein
MKKCKYCGTDGEGQFCESCSAEFVEEVEEEYIKGEPFFYNGYIVWWIRELSSDFHKVYFYLGDRLVEVIEFSHGFLCQIDGYEEGISMWPFVWELFKAAHGEEEVLKVKERNNIRPAMFEIRRIEPEKLSEKDAMTNWLHEYM